jgi:hypothetical protein
MTTLILRTPHDLGGLDYELDQTTRQKMAKF